MLDYGLGCNLDWAFHRLARDQRINFTIEYSQLLLTFLSRLIRHDTFALQLNYPIVDEFRPARALELTTAGHAYDLVVEAISFFARLNLVLDVYLPLLCLGVDADVLAQIVHRGIWLPVVGQASPCRPYLFQRLFDVPRSKNRGLLFQMRQAYYFELLWLFLLYF